MSLLEAEAWRLACAPGVTRQNAMGAFAGLDARQALARAGRLGPRARTGLVEALEAIERGAHEGAARRLAAQHQKERG